MYVRTSRQQFGLSGWGLGDALVTSLASAIRQVEGSNPNFAANNNPGNLVFVGQSGATMGAGGFAAFPTQAAGEAALDWQIQNYINRGYNLTQFFNTYAPGGTSNAAGGVQTQYATNSYVQTVANQLGLDPSVPLSSIQAGYSGSDTSGSGSPAVSGGLDLASYLPGSISSLLPGSDQTYSLGGVVLSGSDLVVLGLGLAAVLVVSAIL